MRLQTAASTNAGIRYSTSESRNCVLRISPLAIVEFIHFGIENEAGA